MSFAQNKTLILTGASMGIGRALALELAGRGARLALNARSPEPLAAAARDCRALGAEVAEVPGDASRAGTVDELVERALAMGGYVGFIHAAGVLAPGPYLWELPEESFRAVLEASVVAAWQLVRAAVPPLRAQGQGVAVFFGSGAAEIAQAGIGAYCAAKAAEEHLMRQLANEAPELDVFAFRPGVVNTRMQEQARESRGGGSEALRRVFQGWKDQDELLSPEEAARALLRLLDEPERHRGRVVRV